jgi:hypothetical protein
MRLLPEELSALDEFRRSHPNPPTRPKAAGMLFRRAVPKGQAERRGHVVMHFRGNVDEQGDLGGPHQAQESL